ncbi:hypothetical protein [Edwardsiella tarda]|uniref:Uncharacterized protein n=1 Tax=Edwardsiella tarda ATCC 15947 = NBRC 105688 TaxID=667121 RepID=A0AC61TG35_EDWTA|nr:hypothetical protein [Edwardsiella tarda]UAL57497.1 hypothetical protein K8O98_06185 [Edwardsiella tarda]UCP99442.1 hypothetical protein DCL27_12330 [Edwardsiella tarda ATCC 15947 = NBRC 105688]
MKTLYLRFDNKEQAELILTNNGFKLDENGVMYSESAYIDVIGVIHGDVTLGEQGNVISQAPDLPGWHVNLLVPDDYSLQPPGVAVTVTTPVRKWAGY